MLKKETVLKCASYVANSENNDYVLKLYDGERAYVPKKNIKNSSPISLKKDIVG